MNEYFTKQNGNHGFNDSSKVDSLLFDLLPMEIRKRSWVEDSFMPKIWCKSRSIFAKQSKKPWLVGLCKGLYYPVI